MGPGARGSASSAAAAPAMLWMSKLAQHRVNGAGRAVEVDAARAAALQGWLGCLILHRSVATRVRVVADR